MTGFRACLDLYSADAFAADEGEGDGAQEKQTKSAHLPASPRSVARRAATRSNLLTLVLSFFVSQSSGSTAPPVHARNSARFVPPGRAPALNHEVNALGASSNSRAASCTVLKFAVTNAFSFATAGVISCMGHELAHERMERQDDSFRIRKATM